MKLTIEIDLNDTLRQTSELGSFLSSLTQQIMPNITLTKDRKEIAVLAAAGPMYDYTGTYVGEFKISPEHE